MPSYTDNVARSQELVGELIDYCDKMDGKSADFVSSMKERLAKYGDDTYVSRKQLEWLESLAEKWL